MGQYFYFYNETRKEAAKTVPCNNGLGWFPKLDIYSEDEQLEIFQDIIKEHGWDMSDSISASGDNDGFVMYKAGVITCNE